MQKKLKPCFSDFDPELPTFGEPYPPPLGYMTDQIIRNRQELAYEILCNPAFLSLWKWWEQIQQMHSSWLWPLGESSSRYISWLRQRYLSLSVNKLLKWDDPDFRTREYERLKLHDAIIAFGQDKRIAEELRQLSIAFQQGFSDGIAQK